MVLPWRSHAARLLRAVPYILPHRCRYSNAMTTITCFKAYDVRGRVPEELNEDVVYRIGRGYAEFLKPRTVAVSRDIRLSSDALTDV